MALGRALQTVGSTSASCAAEVSSKWAWLSLVHPCCADRKIHLHADHRKADGAAARTGASARRTSCPRAACEALAVVRLGVCRPSGPRPRTGTRALPRVWRARLTDQTDQPCVRQGSQGCWLGRRATVHPIGPGAIGAFRDDISNQRRRRNFWRCAVQLACTTAARTGQLRLMGRRKGRTGCGAGTARGRVLGVFVVMGA